MKRVLGLALLTAFYCGCDDEDDSPEETTQSVEQQQCQDLQAQQAQALRLLASQGFTLQEQQQLEENQQQLQHCQQIQQPDTQQQQAGGTSGLPPIPTADDCRDDGGFWYGGTCYDAAITCKKSEGKKPDSAGEQCVGMTIAEADTAASCRAIDGFWYGSDCHGTIVTCVDLETPTASGEACVDKTAEQAEDRTECLALNGYWYDEDDVNQVDADGFANLSPSCHSVATHSCPESGTLPYLLNDDDTLVDDLVTETSLNKNTEDDVIKNLSTMRCFTELDTFYSAQGILTSFDGHLNEALDDLDLGQNDLTWIDLSRNHALTDLSLDANANLDLPDLSHLTGLEELNLGNNAQIEYFDPSPFADLWTITLSSTGISSIDFNANTQLRYIYLNYTSLDIDAMLATIPAPTQLFGLSLTGAGYTGTFDPSPYTNLAVLYLGLNSITDIDVSANTSLQYLGLDGNLMSSLDVSDLSILTYLTLQNSGLDSLTLPASASLSNVVLDGNNIGSLDLSASTGLSLVFAAGALDTGSSHTFDFSSHPNLYYLVMPDNNITSVTLPASSNLMNTVNLADNELTSLDTNDTPYLRTLILDNAFSDATTVDIDGDGSDLDISESTGLFYFHMQNNTVGTVDLAVNTSITRLYLHNTDLDNSGADIDLSALSGLNSLTLFGNASYTLMFEDSGDNPLFHADVLAAGEKSFTVESAKWTGNSDSNKPSWSNCGTFPAGFGDLEGEDYCRGTGSFEPYYAWVPSY